MLPERLGKQEGNVLPHPVGLLPEFENAAAPRGCRGEIWLGNTEHKHSLLGFGF